MTLPLVEDLIVELGLGAHDLLRIISTAPARYKVYQIPKRRGGFRIIAQPARELKEIQRFVLQNTLSKLPVHSAASGYVKGKNIGDNARSHSRSRCLLKLDFKDFFPSITVRDWELYATSARLGFSADEMVLYSHVLFWGRGSFQPRCLSIGAPTSPILSNILLFEIDSKIAEAASMANVIYTRYADDITASGEEVEDLVRFEALVRSIIRATSSPRLTFNEEKRGIYTMGQRRMVTGLVLTPTKAVSIGRERKRLISAMLHAASLRRLDQETTGILKGWLGFCLANEPAFVSRMRVKYGDNLVDRVLRFRVPERRLLSR